jgi:hypothetical protein
METYIEPRELVDDPGLPDLCERCHDVVGRLLDEGRAELEKGED